MTFPVQIETNNGCFTARLVGAPDVRASGPSRAEAIAALETCIEQRLAQGDLVALDVKPLGISGLAGKYRDDPTLQEICDEAYRLRDAELVE